MKKTKTIYFNDFVNEFMAYGRFEQMGEYDGLKALYDYLEELEEDTGEDIELDVIALCCDYTYCTERDLLIDFSHLGDNINDVIEELKNITTVLYTEKGNYIIREF